MLSAALVSREYKIYLKKRLSECEGFLSFLTHIRIEIGCFLRPIKELCASFESEALYEAGFLGALSESENIYEAYKKCEASLSLDGDEKRVLETLFINLGEGYLNDGVRLIDAAHEKMEELTAAERERSAKNIKLATVLSVTASLGFFMLVI